MFITFDKFKSKVNCGDYNLLSMAIINSGILISNALENIAISISELSKVKKNEYLTEKNTNKE